MTSADQLNCRRHSASQRQKAAISFSKVLLKLDQQRANEVALLRQQIALMTDLPHMAGFMEQSKARLAEIERLASQDDRVSEEPTL